MVKLIKNCLLALAASQTVYAKVYYVTSDEKMTWDDSVKHCKSLETSVKTELAIVNDLATLDWIKDNIIGKDWFDAYWLGARQTNKNYIGQPQNQRDFEWLDGTHVSDNLWVQGYEPNNWGGHLESCVNLLNKEWLYNIKNVSGWLNDGACTNKHQAMCKVIFEDSKGQKVYYVTSDDKMTWDDAVKYCESLKTSSMIELAEINDLVTLEWIKDNVIGGDWFDAYWVGARQINKNYIGQPKNQRDFEWLDGSHVNDKLWIQGYEPNNYGGHLESCVNLLNKEWVWGNKNVSGWLNDEICTHKYQAVCKAIF